MQYDVKGFTVTLGPNNPLTLVVVSNLANVYRKTGDGKAVELFERAVVGNEETKGSDHSDTLAAQVDLTSTSESSGLYDKAILYYHQVRTCESHCT